MDKEHLSKAIELTRKIKSHEVGLDSLEKMTINYIMYSASDSETGNPVANEIFNRFKDELITHTTVELNKLKAEFEAL